MILGLISVGVALGLAIGAMLWMPSADPQGAREDVAEPKLGRSATEPQSNLDVAARKQLPPADGTLSGEQPVPANGSEKAVRATTAQKPVPPPPQPRVLRADGATAVEELADFAFPSAVDFAADGRWLVAEKGANRIVVDDGKGTKKYLSVAAPVDADFLPAGGYLVTSSKDRSVVQLDESGNTVWRYDALKRPMDADRLANGNTLIADGGPGRVLEVDPDGKLVWSHEEGLLLPRDVELAADGNVLVADYNRHEVRCLRREGTTCWRLPHIGHPSSLELLEDGRRMLVGTHKAGSIVLAETGPRMLANWRIGPDLEDFALSPSGALLVAQMVQPDRAIPFEARDRRVLQLLAATGGGAPAPAGNDDVVGVDGVKTAGKNLIVILFDSLRSDHVSWHGYWRETAPRLAELAAAGLVFDQYITQAPWTKPSVASLLTSTYGSSHGATSQKPQSRLPNSLTTLAEVLSASGYYTAAVMENPHMGDRRSSKGFEQGYQRYDYLGGKKLAAQQPGLIGDKAIEILGQRPIDRPFS